MYTWFLIFYLKIWGKTEFEKNQFKSKLDFENKQQTRALHDQDISVDFPPPQTSSLKNKGKKRIYNTHAKFKYEFFGRKVLWGVNILYGSRSLTCHDPWPLTLSPQLWAPILQNPVYPFFQGRARKLPSQCLIYAGWILKFSLSLKENARQIRLSFHREPLPDPFSTPYTIHHICVCWVLKDQKKNKEKTL